jgi:hypothetical protein
MKRVINFQRWWIQPPMPDESMRSVLNRAAALYGRTSAQLWASLNSDDPRPAGDVESPSSAALRRMAAAIGMPASELLAHRQPDTPWLLAPHARNVCCPMCWDEDRARGEPCSIRRGWNRLLRTACPQHGCPLRIAPEQWARFTPSHPLPVPQLSEQEQQILDLIESFGQTLEQSIYFGERWPDDWRGNAQLARQLLLAVSFNVNEVRNFPLINYAQVSGNLTGLIRGTRHQYEPVRKLRWDSYREIADPALRRAGLWVTAWTLLPDLPVELSPGWLKLPAHVGARIRCL